MITGFLRSRHALLFFLKYSRQFSPTFNPGRCGSFAQNWHRPLDNAEALDFDRLLLLVVSITNLMPSIEY